MNKLFRSALVAASVCVAALSLAPATAGADPAPKPPEPIIPTHPVGPFWGTPVLATCSGTFVKYPEVYNPTCADTSYQYELTKTMWVKWEEWQGIGWTTVVAKFPKGSRVIPGVAVFADHPVAMNTGETQFTHIRLVFPHSPQQINITLPRR